MSDQKIPDELINSMSRAMNIDTTKYRTPLEAIMSERAKNMPQTQEAPAIPTIEIDGYKLPVDAMTMLMYIIATELGKDPKVQRILNAFNFQFPDLNRKMIYPRKNATVRSSKRRVR